MESSSPKIGIGIDFDRDTDVEGGRGIVAAPPHPPWNTTLLSTSTTFCSSKGFRM
mgnify:CR=1 FL=1